MMARSRRRFRELSRTALALALCGAAFVWTSPPGMAAVPGRNGLIAYDGINTVHVVRPDGTDDHTIASGLCPEWSPDGTRIAFEATNGDTVVTDPDGGNFTVVAHAGCVDWSPDGTRFAFYRTIGGYQSHIFVMDVDGSDVQQVARGYGVPAWSPDGRRLAFYSGNGRLTIFDLVTGRWRFLAQAPEASDHPDWSPDGTKVFFTSGDDLWTVDVRTGQEVDVTPTQHRFEAEPAWSPDGRRIVARVQDGINGCVCIVTMNTDGTGARVVSDGVGGRPDWQPLPG